MNGHPSLSIFTIEIDGRPTLVVQAKKHREVEALCEEDGLRANVSGLTSHGVPLCDDRSILRVRLARPDEAALYRQATEGHKPSGELRIVYLADVDGDLF
jgi:hypothetical protein